MSSIGLGSNKKGSRVADSSMLTRNVKLLAVERGIATELNVLKLGNLGVPTFRTYTAETIQVVYNNTTPAVLGALNSAVQIRRRIRQ